MNVTTVGLDLAKNVFHIVGLSGQGREVLKKRLTRSQVLKHFANTPRCAVAMEACASSHYFARELRKLGHESKLIPPQYVKAYVRGQKNDYNDARAIAEAARVPAMRVVAALLADATNGLSERFRRLLKQGHTELIELDAHIEVLTAELKAAAREDDAAQRLQTIPGFGPIVAAVFAASLGDGRQFPNGRAASAAVGLVPRQHSSGGKPLLLGITKRGDRYLRSLLVHGARAVVRAAQNKDDHLSRWVNRLREARGMNKATVALANKLTRIGWAVLAHKSVYQPA